MMERLIEILTDILETEINEYTTKDDVETWDSLNHVRIISEIQDEFNIRIPLKDINSLISVKAIQQYLRKNDTISGS